MSGRRLQISSNGGGAGFRTLAAVRRFLHSWCGSESIGNRYYDTRAACESRLPLERAEVEFLPCGCNCGEAKKSFCSDKGPARGRLVERSLSEVDDQMA